MRDDGPWTGPASGRSRPAQLSRCAVQALLGLASPLQCRFPGDVAGLTDKPTSVVRGPGAGRRRCSRKHSACLWVPSHVYITHRAHAESTGAAVTTLAGRLEETAASRMVQKGIPLGQAGFFGKRGSSESEVQAELSCPHLEV